MRRPPSLARLRRFAGAHSTVMVLPAVEGGLTYTSSLAASDIVKRDASFATAYQSWRTICSGECLLPIKSPAYAHSWLLDARSRWTSLRVAGQLPQSMKDAGGRVALVLEPRHPALFTRLASEGE